jgi:hypothetical protein
LAPFPKQDEDEACGNGPASKQTNHQIFEQKTKTLEKDACLHTAFRFLQAARRQIKCCRDFFTKKKS